MLAYAAAFFFVPAILCFVAASLLLSGGNTFPKGLYLLSIILPALPCWLYYAVGAYRYGENCAPACDGLTGLFMFIAAFGAASIAALGGFTGAFSAVEWSNRRA